MQTITVSNAAGMNRNVILDRVRRNRALGMSRGVVHLGKKPCEQKVEDPAVLRAILRSQLTNAFRDGKLTMSMALEQATVGEIGNLPEFRLELLRALPAFKHLNDEERERRWVVIEANRVNIIA